MAAQAQKISALFVLVLACSSCIGTVREERSADFVNRLLQLLREKKAESLSVPPEELQLRKITPEALPVQTLDLNTNTHDAAVGDDESIQRREITPEALPVQTLDLNTNTHDAAVGDDESIQRRASNPCYGRGVTLRATTGTISTPGYGTHRYPNSAHCTWTIISRDTRAKIKLQFKTPFSIETGPRCRYDSITVLDGSGSGAKAVGKYCNSNPPPVTLLRNTSVVSLQFVSDFSTTGRGFTLQYTIIPGPRPAGEGACGAGRVETLQGETGTVTSQNYPRAYGLDLTCTWLIRVPAGRKVRLDVEDFEFEADLTCEYDSLSVYDGSSTRAGLIGKYCGTKVPKDITTSGNTALLTLKSDGSVSKKGFKISYTAIRVSSPAPPKPDNPDEPPDRPPPTPPTGPQVDLNCTFEEGTMCMWTAGAGGNINWELKQAKYNTFRISNGERWGNKDHTTDDSNGHYIVIDGSGRVSTPNARGFLVSPLMSAGPEDGRCLHLWYNMYFTKGVLQVVMRRDDESDEVIWQRDGFQGNGWHRGRISLVSSRPYRILLVGSRGDKDKETGIAVDDISFVNTPCLSISLNCGQRHSSISKRSVLQDLLHPNTKTAAEIEPNEEALARRILGGQTSRDEEALARRILGGQTSRDEEALARRILGGQTSRDEEALARRILGGQTSTDGEALARRILGGQTSKLGMWPWVVNIRTTPPEGGTFMACGGSLIDQQWVLTAAHCFEYEGEWLTNPDKIELRLGEANVGRDQWEDSQINIRPIKVIIHPQRSKRKMGQVAPYDLALVQLPHRVTLNEQINVVCLPPAGSSFRPGSSCVVTGWGKTEDGRVQGSEHLLHVDLELLSTSLCRGYFGSSIGHDVICAKHRREVKAACKGDSGGPLVCRSGDHYILAGVVSWGVPCSKHAQPLPSVFARVTYYLPWIESTINAEQ